MGFGISSRFHAVFRAEQAVVPSTPGRLNDNMFTNRRPTFYQRRFGHWRLRKYVKAKNDIRNIMKMKAKTKRKKLRFTEEEYLSLVEQCKEDSNEKISFGFGMTLKRKTTDQ